MNLLFLCASDSDPRCQYAARLAIFILAAHLGQVGSVLLAQPAAARPLAGDPASWPANYQPSLVNNVEAAKTRLLLFEALVEQKP